MLKFITMILLFMDGAAFATPLQPSNTWGTTYPGPYRRGTPTLLTAKGIADNEVYVIEVDPVTGAIPVSATFSGSISATTAYNRGSGGVYVQQTPTYDLTTPANNRPMPMEILAGDSLGPVAVGAGTTSAATLRVVLPTDQTAIPVTTAPNVSDFGVTTSAQRVAAVIGNTTGQAAFGAGATSAQTLRAVLVTDQTAIPASQSGTWTVQPGNTANTTPWLTSISHGGNTATVTAGSALVVDGSAVTQPISGTVTANQGGAPWTVTGTGSAGTAASGVVTVQGIASMTPLLVDGSATTQPISGTVTANQGGTWTVQPGNIANTTPWVSTISQGGNSATVTASNALKVDGSAVTQPVSGTVSASQSGTWTVQPGNTANTTPWLATISQGGNSATVTAGSALKVDGSAVTQPISGTVTSNQGGAPWTVTGTGTAGTAASGVVTVQGIASMTALVVDGSAVTQPISGTVTANQGGSWTVAATQSGTWSTRTQDGSGNTISSTSNALDVNLKTTNLDQGSGLAGATTLRTIPAGRDSTKTTLARNDYSSVNVTTGAYVQLIASTTNAINRLCVFDSSGSAIKIATGAAASEVDRIYMPPGGPSYCYEINIPASTRISLEALDANATSGQIIVTGLP